MIDVQKQYTERFNLALAPVAPLLESLVSEFFKGIHHIDKISVRPKSIQSFLQKASLIEGDQNKYRDPYNQILDQLGARIVCFYLDDVEMITARALKYFHPIEIQDIIPETESEFGYFGKHLLLLLPADLSVDLPKPELLPQVFELQVKTLFQHAWAQANHDLAYKPTQQLATDTMRRVAFTAAQSWGADVIFNELKGKPP